MSHEEFMRLHIGTFLREAPEELVEEARRSRDFSRSRGLPDPLYYIVHPYFWAGETGALPETAPPKTFRSIW